MGTSVQTKSVFAFIPMSLAKTGIGISIVAFSSFLNAELAFRNWSPSVISLVIGSTAIFELIRFIFARLSDQTNKSRKFYLIGFALASLGIAMIPAFLSPSNTWLIAIPMAFFYMGSAVMSTLIDSHMTACSRDSERSNISTAIQITRLSGFAIGGIVGAQIFATRGTPQELNFAGDFFTSFTILILSAFYITGMVSLLSMNDNERIINTAAPFDFGGLKDDLSSSMSIMMMIFLYLYPIGLFMQDQILEPFAILRLDFGENQIGRLVSIWAALTLIFAPVGNVVANRISKLTALISGQIIGSLGLVLIAFSGYQLSSSLLYMGVVLFGMGSGLFAVPGVGYMLDVVALHPKNLALMLSFFGVINTLSRSSAATLASVILYYSSNNFELVFLIEAGFFTVCIFPILKLEKLLKQQAN